MALDSRFSRIWFAWRRTPAPVDHFKSGQRNANAYDLECALDHLASAVNGLGNAYLARKEWDYTGIASGDLAELERLKSVLKSLTVSEEEQSHYRSYLELTEAVLEAIQRSDASSLPTELFDGDRTGEG